MGWRSRPTAFIVCNLTGIVAALVLAYFFGISPRHQRDSIPSAPISIRCAAADYFNQPEEVLAALKDADVNTRHTMCARLFLHPGLTTVYYDYERDMIFHERADRARLQYIPFDHSPDNE